METAPEFRGLLEAAPDAMVGVDRSGRIVWVNGQCEVLFGYRRDELVGQDVELLVPERARAAHPHHRAAYFESPKTRPMGAGLELDARRKDGTTFPAEISLSAFRTDDDVVVTAAIRDVSAQKAVQDELRAARREAERANQAKSEFLSRMSHELRTPLNAVLGFAQLLELEEVDETASEYVRLIRGAGRHLLDLINEVLDISRIETGHIELIIEDVRLTEVVREALELLDTYAQEQQVLLRVDPDASHRLHVRADRQRLKQVVLNLVSNGLKYNRPGGEVTLGWEQEGDWVRLDVHDTGSGIRADHFERLFQPFDRLDAGSDVEGTGLGLALSKRLVDTMGGEIGVESQVGQGSRFWVLIPLASVGGEELEGGADVPDSPATCRRVLYVEDNLSNMRLVERILDRLDDIELVPTLQGALALDLARQHQPDLILLDLNLPDMSGREVLHRLSREPSTAGIPVIIVSADAMEASRAELLARGAFAYVSKPFDVRELLDVVGVALGIDAPS